MPAPNAINQLTTLFAQQPQPWDQMSPLNKLAALFTTSVPAPLVADRQTDLPFESAFQQAATRYFTPPTQPTPWRDVVAALGNVAQMGIMGRGGFGTSPYSQVMEGGKPKRVYHGTPSVYQKMDPEMTGSGSGGDLYGPSPGGYWTESAKTASGYAERLQPHPAAAQNWIDRQKQYIDSMRQEAARLTPEVDMWGGRKRMLLEQAKWLEGDLGPTADRLFNLKAAPNIRVAYLDITKPFDINATVTTDALKEIAGAAKDLGYGLEGWLSEGRRAGFFGATMTGDQLYTVLAGETGKPQITEILARAGYDGITHIGQSGARQWIPFRSDQVHEGFQPPQ